MFSIHLISCKDSKQIMNGSERVKINISSFIKRCSKHKTLISHWQIIQQPFLLQSRFCHIRGCRFRRETCTDCEWWRPSHRQDCEAGVDRTPAEVDQTQCEARGLLRDTESPAADCSVTSWSPDDSHTTSAVWHTITCKRQAQQDISAVRINYFYTFTFLVFMQLCIGHCDSKR